VCACTSAAQLICVLCNVLNGDVCVSFWSATLHGVCMDVINYLCMPMYGVCVCVCVCVCMCAISSYACLEERETMLNMQVEG